MSLLPFLHIVSDHRSLSTDQAREAMHIILTGQATPVHIGAFLVALRMKRETVDELVGFARAMREMAVPIEVGLNGEPLLDTCGTGGDGLSTFNISTVSAFVVAAAGVRVAKHGNRSISSQCGSADLLEMLGVRIPMPPEVCARAIREIGIGFLFAPAVHTATKHVHPVRLELKMRTVFNLLGPLTNPAGATAQLAGTPSAHAAELIAGALARLGLRRGFVVHGSDGLDEITTTGPTLAYEIHDGRVEKRTLLPEHFGVETARPEDLRGGDKHQNCEIALAVLKGALGAQRNIVLVNAAAAIVASGKAADFADGVRLAVAAIDSGAARKKVQALAEFTAATQ
ncbi:MAG: anthranilate phosphoribosyltransferase [Bryobacteraceae bacterium]